MRWKWVILALAALLAAGVCFSTASRIRRDLARSLSAACRRPVSIQSAQLLLPAGVRLTGIHVPRLPSEQRAPFSVEEIRVRASFGAMAQGQMGAELEMVRPKIYTEWSRETRNYLQYVGLVKSGNPSVPMAGIRVQDGDLTLVDRTVVPNMWWELRGTSLQVRVGPGEGQCTFTLSASLQDKSGGPMGTLQAEGSVFPRGPVDAKILLSHQGIEHLAPYLRPVLGTAPSQGSMEMETRLTVLQGVVMAHNEVTARGVAFPTDEPTTLGPDGNRLARLLADREGKIHLSFVVSGKAGEKMDWSDMAAGALHEAMRQAMTRSIQSVLDQKEQQQPVGEEIRKGLESLGR